MNFSVLGNGWITRQDPQAGGNLAAGSRLAVLPNGTVLCSCMLTSALGTNDFVPVLMRSEDDGRTWSEPRPIWPHLRENWSIFANISSDARGRVFLFGSRTKIEVPGEPFWSDATAGLKQNELCWSVSEDGGQTFCDPQPIPMPIPGSAEAPGAMRVLSSGRWIGLYSPYNTFDPHLVVDRSQTVVVYSDDAGAHWRHGCMLRYTEPDAGSAEAWLVEIPGGRLLGAGWHLDFAAKAEYPNAFALSFDGGTSWTHTTSTGILGQSTALGVLPDGRALFIYNQRKHGEIGVWLAVVAPTETDFGIILNAPIWKAPTSTQSQTSGEHAEWTDFSFGEPAIAVLRDGTLLAALWCIQPDGRGIRSVHLRIDED